MVGGSVPVITYFIKAQFRVTQDNGEHVVEVVGDAACEGPYCFHLLRLDELLLGLFPVFGFIKELMVRVLYFFSPLLDASLKLITGLAKLLLHMLALGDVVYHPD